MSLWPSGEQLKTKEKRLGNLKGEKKENKSVEKIRKVRTREEKVQEEGC